VLGTVSVNAVGAASFTTASLPLGPNAITAVYVGTGSILSSISPAVSVSVIPYSTVTILASSSNPSIVGQPITFMASIVTNTGAGVTAGTVTFRRGKRLLGTVPLSSSGTAALPISSQAVGTTGIQAIYNGTANDLRSVSAVVKQRVGAAPTVTSLSVTIQTLANGQTRYVLVATVTTNGDSALTPIGTVIFRKNGKSLGSARLRSGVATLVYRSKAAESPAKFVASFDKNTRFRSSTSLPVQFRV
jgi:hypothetical protein